MFAQQPGWQAFAPGVFVTTHGLTGNRTVAAHSELASTSESKALPITEVHISYHRAIATDQPSSIQGAIVVSLATLLMISTAIGMFVFEADSGTH